MIPHSGPHAGQITICTSRVNANVCPWLTECRHFLHPSFQIKYTLAFYTRSSYIGFVLIWQGAAPEWSLVCFFSPATNRCNPSTFTDLHSCNDVFVPFYSSLLLFLFIFPFLLFTHPFHLCWLVEMHHIGLLLLFLSLLLLWKWLFVLSGLLVPICLCFTGRCQTMNTVALTVTLIVEYVIKTNYMCLWVSCCGAWVVPTSPPGVAEDRPICLL